MKPVFRATKIKVSRATVRAVICTLRMVRLTRVALQGSQSGALSASAVWSGIIRMRRGGFVACIAISGSLQADSKEAGSLRP
jgi:hypothetical protein